MLIDIPTKQDFYNAADDIVNQIWGRFAGLAYDYREKNELNKFYKNPRMYDDLNRDGDFDEYVIDISDYWSNYQREINSSIILILQSIEFRIKGLIAEVSPYLLIVNSANNLPTLDRDGLVSFTDFQTVNANDLTKIYKTFSDKELSGKFIQWFSDLRKKRNKLVHTVDSNSNIDIGMIFKSIIIAHNELNKENGSWMINRYKYEATRANSDGLFKTIEMGEIDVLPSIYQEFSGVVDQLTNAETKNLLYYDKKAKSFTCTHCYELMDRSSYERVNRILDYCHLTVQYNSIENKYICCICNTSYDDEPRYRLDDEE